MISQPIQSGADTGFSVDPKQLESLKASARQNSPEAIKEVARQFEGLFMNMVMKSMRAATPQEGPFENEQSKMFTSMLDQQMSQNLAKRGVGLADVLIRQLSNNRGVDPATLSSGAAGAAGAAGGADAAMQAAAKGATASLDAGLPGLPGMTGRSGGTQALAQAQSDGLGAGWQATLQEALDSGIPGVLKAAFTGLPGAGVRGAVASASTALNDSIARVTGADGRGRSPSSQPAHVRAFEQRLAAHAEDAERATGIPAKFMLGQAALESGWGKREIVAADGTNSHNVFGVKAGASWKGKVVETATTEYVNGVPQRRIERFRAYDSYGDAFRDYAKVLQGNPRFQSVLASAQDLKGFAQGLQRAGYATDPQYAAKLTRIITHSLSA